MKKRIFVIFIVLTFIMEALMIALSLKSTNEYKNDTVKINELIKTIEQNYGDESKYPQMYKYCILNENENVMYKNDEFVSDSLNEAYQNRDTIVDFCNRKNYYK